MNYDQLVQEVATMKHMVITECTMCQIYILSAFLQVVLMEPKNWSQQLQQHLWQSEFTEFTEFTDASMPPDNAGMSTHRLSPYKAYYLY